MRALGLSAVLVVAGCNIQVGQETRGDLGNVSFHYSSGGCFFGCGLDKPLMRGTTERLFAKGTSAILTASFSVEPTDPAQVADGAFSFDEQGNWYRAFDVSAGSVGNAWFSLAGENGKLIDRVTLRIQDAARLNAEWAIQNKNHGPEEKDWSSGPIVQLSGSDVYVRVSAYDGTGQQLQAASGMTVTVSDERIVAVIALEAEASWLRLHPLASGSAIVTATTTSGVSTQLTVIVP